MSRVFARTPAGFYVKGNRGGPYCVMWPNSAKGSEWQHLKNAKAEMKRLQATTGLFKPSDVAQTPVD